MAFRSSAVGTSAANVQTDVTWPTVVSHDRALLFVAKDSSVATFTAPTGFTQLDSQAIATPDAQTFALFEKKDCTGAETGTLSLVSNATQNCVMFLAVWSGRDNTAALTFRPFSSSNIGNATPVSMGATSGTSAASDDLAAFFSIDQTVQTDTWSYTAPSGWTEQQDAAASAWISATLDTLDNVTAAAQGTITGTATRTAGTGTGGWGAFVVAIPALATVIASASASAAGVAFASAAGGTKYAVSPSVAIVDFGQGGNVAQVVITDQSAITSGAFCEAFLMGDSTIYHNAYEHLIVDMDVRCSDIVAGVGFTITATSPWILTGQFVVHYVWSN